MPIKHFETRSPAATQIANSTFRLIRHLPVWRRTI